MNNINKVLALGLGLGTGYIVYNSLVKKSGDGENGDKCGAGYYWDEMVGACIPYSTPPPNDVEMTPAAIRARAELVYSEIVDMPGIARPTPVIANPPPIEISDFRLTDVYQEPIPVIYPADEWIAEIEAYDDNCLVEVAGAPCDSKPWPIPTRVGQLRGHTWGVRLMIYRWDGGIEYLGRDESIEKPIWNLVFEGKLGPNQGWIGTPECELAKGMLTIISSQDWIVPPETLTPKIEMHKFEDYKRYCYADVVISDSNNRNDWLSLRQGIPCDIPITIKARPPTPGPFNFNSYSGSGPMELNMYSVNVRINWRGSVMSYNPDWYYPPSTKSNYLTHEDLGILGDGQYDQNIRNTIFSYSISRSELLSDALKIYYFPEGCGCVGTPPFNEPQYGIPQFNGTCKQSNLNLGLITGKFSIDVSSRGAQ